MAHGGAEAATMLQLQRRRRAEPRRRRDTGLGWTAVVNSSCRNFSHWPSPSVAGDSTRHLRIGRATCSVPTQRASERFLLFVRQRNSGKQRNGNPGRHCARAGDRDHGAGMGAADGAASAPHPWPPPPALLLAGRRPRCTSLPCSAPSLPCYAPSP